ncbi:MAG: zf-TFIIB domain-containing protein [Planctomycetota bacterium]|nr:zf-TFIIB domain-containing protein [Planctomycetota bacterium]
MAPDPGPPDALLCPLDGYIMQRVTVDGVGVDKCGGCHALWFDALELEKVLAAPGAVAALEPDPSPRAPNGAPASPKCPRCAALLIRTRDLRQRHVHLLSCTVCGGVLLDAGEFTDLSHFSLLERVRAYFSLG